MDRTPRLIFSALPTNPGIKDLYRAEVPGGWIVHQGRSSFFVPDPRHEWEAEFHLEQVKEWYAARLRK